MSYARPIVRRAAAALLVVAVAGPTAAQAPAVRDALGNEAIGLMIDNAGDGQAEALLGVLYLRGVRIDPDPIAALAWFTRAATDGHPAGVYGAARMLAEGLGVPADRDRARALLRERPPSAFGPLADAVRQLRLSLDLPAEPDPTPPVVAAPTAPAPTPPPKEAAPLPASAPVAAVPAQAPQPAPGAPAVAAATPAPAPASPASPQTAAAAPTAAPAPTPTAPPTPPVQAAAPAPAPAPAPTPSPPPVWSLPPAPSYRITAGRGPDAEALRQLNDRIGRTQRALVAGTERKILPAFEPGGLVWVLTIDGLPSAQAVQRLCEAVGRSRADCAPTPSEATPAVAAAPAAPAPPPAAEASAAVDLGPAHVQLSTVFDEGAVATERARLRRLVTDAVLNGRTIDARPIVLSDGREGFSIYVARFDSLADARQFCERLRAQRVDCIPRT